MKLPNIYIIKYNEYLPARPHISLQVAVDYDYCMTVTIKELELESDQQCHFNKLCMVQYVSAG